MSKKNSINKNINSFMSSVRLYPRGFIGPTSSHMRNFSEEKVELKTEMTQAVLQMGIEREASRVLGHTEVEEIYFATRTNPNLLNQFEIRERIIKVAKEVFTVKPYMFMASQMSSPCFSRNHFDFLQYILDFAKTGQTKLTATIWSNLIKGSNEHLKTGQMVDMQDVLKFIDDNPLLDNRETLITEILNKPQGWSQMLIFLHIMVGDVDNPKDGVLSSMKPKLWRL